MKRFITVLLTLCLLAGLGTTLTSCTALISKILPQDSLPKLHKCEFSDAWTSDEGSHWHVCKSALCSEISDKADHTWDDGVITTEATADKKGVKTFTCTVCGHEKTEETEFAGLTKEAWEKAFEDSVFENFTYREKAVVKATGVSAESETIYKFTKDNAWVKMTIAGQSQEQFAPDKESAIELRRQMVDSIRSMTSFDDYEFDAETKTYKATKEITFAVLNASTSDVSLKFEDGKLVEMVYSIEYTQDGVKLEAESTITLSDYGTVAFETPDNNI